MRLLNRPLLGLLSLGHLTVDVTGGALPAMLPFLQAEFHLSYLLLALVILTSNVTSSIVQPIFGVVSDISAARYLLPAGVLLAVAGFSALGLAPSYGLLLIAVAVAGIGSAIYHPEASKSAAYVVGARRATGMSVFSVGGNVGFALGPLALTAIVAWHGLRGTWFMLIPGLLMAGALAGIMPAIARAQVEHEERARADRGTSHPRRMALLVAIVTLRSLVYSGVLTFAPLYAVNVLHRSPHAGALLLFLFLGAGATGTIVAGPIADRFGKRRTMVVGLWLVVPLLAMYLVIPGPLSLVALALAGMCLIGTFTVSLLMGQEFLPTRLALASALMIGFTTGLGGLGVGLLGRFADVAGLIPTLWAVVAMAALASGLMLALPESEVTREPAPDLRTATAR